MQNAQSNLAIGTVVQGRYAVESLLGKGGFGAVYLVRDRRVGQNLFALKEVIDSSKEEMDRFTYEGELLRRLDHPALPRVYRVFTDSKNGRAYMLMDYIAGIELKMLQQQYSEGRFPLPQVLSIMAPIIDAVGYLHDQHPPIVHRDIKLANIIVPSNGSEAVLVDFGIAKEYKPDATTTSVPRLTPGYAAPEQYTGGTNTRTDIYGLGVTFYTLLTGVLPANAWSRITELGSMGNDPLEPLNRLVPSLPMPVAQAIHRAMSMRGSDRFATVREFWQALNANANWQQPAAPVILPPVPSHPPVVPPPQPQQSPAPLVLPSASSYPSHPPVVSPPQPQQPATPVVLRSASSYPSHPPVVPPRQQSPTPLVLPSASSYPSIGPTQAVNDTSNALLQRQPQTSRPGRLGILLLVLLVLLIALGSGIGLLFYIVSSHSPSVVSSPVRSPATRATQTVVASPGTRTTQIVTAYPNVMGVHNGTVNNTTAGVFGVSLSVSLQQHSGNISGYVTIGYQLQGSGPIISGSVSTNNAIQFTVMGSNRLAPLSFQGTVQPDGSMKGTYCSIDQANQCNSASGGAGNWNVSPASG